MEQQYSIQVMQINVSYDQNQSSLPAGFVNAVSYAVNYLDSLLTANVTITLHVGYGEIAGSSLEPGALGESVFTQYAVANYSDVRNALLAQGAPGASSLPANPPLSGTLLMSPAEAQAMGVGSAATANYYVGLQRHPRHIQLRPQRTASLGTSTISLASPSMRLPRTWAGSR